MKARRDRTVYEPFHNQNWHRLIPAAAGFFGAVVMLSYIGEMPIGHWVAALGTAVLTAYFAPPVVVAWLAHQGLAWLPTDGSVEGLLGLGLGFASIHLIGAATVIGRRFSQDPISFIRRKGE